MELGFVLLGVPVAAAVLVAALKRPEWVLLAALAMIAAEGSIEAFVGRNPYPVVQLLLGCFVLGRLAVLVYGRRDTRLMLWPWLLPIAVYVLFTAVAGVVAQTLNLGWHGFKDAAWFMLVGLVAGLTLSDERTRRRLLRGVVVLSALVGAYAGLRWLIGPAAQELAVATKPGRNTDFGDRIGLFGSFGERDALARWAAFTIPLCIAVAMFQYGAWRIVAMVAAALCAVAMFGSEVRSAAVAVVPATALVVVLHRFAAAKRGLRLGTTFAALVLAGGVAAAAYTVTIGSDPARADRFGNIFSLEDDAAFNTRRTRWAEAIALIEQHPLGLGLGVSGRAADANRYVTLGARRLDSSYLQVTVEQGIPGLIVFVAGVLALLGGLIRRGCLTRDRERATAAIGAAGTLLAWAIMMYTSLAIGGLLAMLPWTLIGVAIAGFTNPAPRREPAPLPLYERPAVAVAGSGAV